MTRAVESRAKTHSQTLVEKHLKEERARLLRDGYPKGYPR